MLPPSIFVIRVQIRDLSIICIVPSSLSSPILALSSTRANSGRVKFAAKSNW